MQGKWYDWGIYLYKLATGTLSDQVHDDSILGQMMAKSDVDDYDRTKHSLEAIGDDTDTLLARLTAARAGYIDEIQQLTRTALSGDIDADVVDGSILGFLLAKSDVSDFDRTKHSLEKIGDEVYETEHHLHNRERWFGKKGTPTGTDWGDQASLTPYRVISGNDDFGQDAGDEAELLGVDDTPAITGMTLFDAHRVMIEASSNANSWVLRLVYGTGTMADAETAGQYTDFMVTEARKGAPVEVISERGTAGATKCWLRGKNATNNATLDFFIGIHEYER